MSGRAILSQYFCVVSIVAHFEISPPSIIKGGMFQSACLHTGEYLKFGMLLRLSGITFN